MVNVEVKRQDGYLQEIIIRDHAGSAPHGQDLVCAGVSCISIGMLNAIDQLTHDNVCDLSMKDAYVKIRLTQRDVTAELLMKTLLIQLQTLEERYHNYISIHDQEV